MRIAKFEENGSLEEKCSKHREMIYTALYEKNDKPSFEIDNLNKLIVAGHSTIQDTMN